MCVFVCGWKAGVCVSHASRSPDKIWAVFLIRSCRELWSLFSPQLNDTASCKKGASNQFVINAVEFLSLPAVFHSPPPDTNNEGVAFYMLFTEVINVSLWIQSETNCTFCSFAGARMENIFPPRGQKGSVQRWHMGGPRIAINCLTGNWGQ